MKRNLLKQIRNEWKENIWLCIEMIIVSVVVWVILVSMIGSVYGIFSPRGFKYDDVYVGDLKYVQRNSPQFIEPTDTSKEAQYRFYADDVRLLLARLREKPYIEAVALGANAMPYNLNHYGTGWVEAGKNDTIIYHANYRAVSPDMALILRYESLDGKSYSEMRDALARGEVIISANPNYEKQGRDPRNLLGKMVVQYDVEGNPLRVGGLIEPVKRTDYEHAWAGTILVPIDESSDVEVLSNMQNIAIKVKPGMGAKLEEDIRNDPTLSRQRDLLIREVRPLSSERTSSQWGSNVKLRQYGISVFFLLFIVFLGQLGTFRYRVEQRVGEIAIRKVSGATSADIFKRFMGESMILIGISTLISWIVEVIMMKTDVIDTEGEDISVIIQLAIYCALAVLLLLIISVAVGVLIPARQAMKIEPAIALKSE